MPSGITGFLGRGGNPKKLEGLLESLAGSKANTLGSLDLDLLAGLRVDSGAGLAVHNLESSKSDQLEALVLLDETFDVLDDSGDYLFGMGLADVFTKGLLNGFDEMLFAAHVCLFWVGLGTACCVNVVIQKKPSPSVNTDSS